MRFITSDYGGVRGEPLIDKLCAAIDSLNGPIRMNIHHLELFYYVAKHGGVSAAARRIPYGIQQPAISAQIIQLEVNLGTTLFHRRPFKLTKAGESLYGFIDPFFSAIDTVAKQLRGGAEVNIRIGAPETIQREYLPRLLKSMRARLPELNFTLIAAPVDRIEACLLAQQIDIGIAPLVNKPSEGVRQKVLLRVPMTLMTPKNHKLASADELWQRDRICEPLITGPSDGAVCRVFQMELQKRKVEWFPTLELNSQELIARYVAEGFGIGLVLIEPGTSPLPGVRLIPLHGFPPIPYGLLWRGILSPLQKTFVHEAQALAAAFSPK
jgi:DNA-binding transcriptional LysR family regulator